MLSVVFNRLRDDSILFYAVLTLLAAVVALRLLAFAVSVFGPKIIAAVIFITAAAFVGHATNPDISWWQFAALGAVSVLLAELLIRLPGLGAVT